MVQVSNDVFRGHGVLISLATPDDFLKVRETLTRIGIKANSKPDQKQKLTQTVHILHKRGKYALMHFKELFMIDGKKSDISDDDYRRRNRIAELLEEWGLVEIIGMDDFENDYQSKDDAAKLYASIKVVPFSEKNNWELVQKYHIGGM